MCFAFEAFAGRSDGSVNIIVFLVTHLLDTKHFQGALPRTIIKHFNTSICFSQSYSSPWWLCLPLSLSLSQTKESNDMIEKTNTEGTGRCGFASPQSDSESSQIAQMQPMQLQKGLDKASLAIPGKSLCPLGSVRILPNRDGNRNLSLNGLPGSCHKTICVLS